MNVVFGKREHLDTATPEGAYCREHGIKVMVSLTRHIYGRPRLAAPVTAEQTVIPLLFPKANALPESGVIQLEDELIRYASRGEAELRDAQRGFRGTEPTAHHEGIHLFFPDKCAAEIEEIKDSPNLFGYYVLDDPPGDVLSGLRALYALVKRIDPNPSHPVCAGYSLLGPLHYFGPGVCDVMMVYIYPARWRGYQRERIPFYLQRMLMTARERVPGIPFIGVQQAFGYPTGNHAMPTSAQLREEMEDYVREGACGLIAFKCETSDTIQGWADYTHMKNVMREAGEELRSTGGLTVAPEPTELAQRRIEPAGFWETPRTVPGLAPAWRVIAPFHDANDEYLNAVFPPEEGIDLAGVYAGQRGKTSWIERQSAAGFMYLTPLFGDDHLTTHCVAYATCEVVSPRTQRVQMRVGSDDDAVIWLNGKEIYRFSGVRGVQEDTDIVEVELPEGQSTLLVKNYNRKGEWGFFMRFTDLDGKPLAGLTFPEK